MTPLLLLAVVAVLVGSGSLGAAPAEMVHWFSLSSDYRGPQPVGSAPIAVSSPNPKPASTHGTSVVTSRAAGIPASVSLKAGWQGLNYSSSCVTTCLPADPDVATGNGYVFEVANTEFRIWTTAGVLVRNASLGSTDLFGTGTDALAAPQVVYDSSTQRWFASVEDVTHDQIFYGGSLTSDPTGSWNIQRFALPGGEIGYVPTQPELAVDSLNLVVTTNVYSGGVFEGAQVFEANKSEVLADTGVSTYSNALSSSNESLTPAEPTGPTPWIYLVSDGTGGNSLFLWNLSGSPGSGSNPPVIKGPVTLTSVTVAPPAASQEDTSNLISTGTARVEDAVWQDGTLWASATVACTPAGDQTVRACLHLWELSTASDSVLQDFNWTTGAGTYDFYPAIAMDAGGDLAVVFEESSASLYPGVYATAQSAADPPGSLEPAQTVKAGTGPDNPTVGCSLGVCPFGNYSGAAVSPLAADTFVLAGEYSGADYATNAWHTWVRSLTVADTYRVVFKESNLPAGTLWSVTVDGAVSNSTTSTITLNKTDGAYSFTVLSPLSAGTGVQLVSNVSAGSFSVASAPVEVPINFTEQFALSTAASPSGAGTVLPAEGWFNASASVSVGALAGPGHAFADWSGSGPGSYSGTANPAVVVMEGPVTEEAQFLTAVTYTVTFTENGLPTAAAWTVALNGLSNSSSGTSLTFNEPNGTYSFYLAGIVPGAAGTRYLASPTTGSFEISGASVLEPISYATQYELTTSVAPSGSGTVSPDGGWFNASSEVTLSALAGPGYSFVSWQGTGTGNYSGAQDPATVSLLAPISEVARFAAVAPSSSSPASLSAPVPLWALIAVLAALAAVLVLLGMALRRRRGPPRTGAPLHPVSLPAPVGPPPGTAGPAEPWREDTPPR